MVPFRHVVDSWRNDRVGLNRRWKRTLQASTVVAAVGVSLGAFAGTSAAATTLKLGMADSNTSPTYKFAQQFANNVSKATKGQVQIKIYPSEELGATSAEITGVQSGSIAFLATPDLDSIVPQVDVALLPYLFSSMNNAEQVLNSSAMQSALWSKFAKYNLQVIGTWPIGPLGVLSSKTGANSLASLKGQRIRVLAPLVMTPLLKAWGMNPTPVDPTQVLSSLSTNLIDGVFDPPTPITSQGWDAYGKSYLQLGAVYNVDPLVMSSKVMSGLSNSQQAAITASFKKTLASADTLIDSQSSQAVSQLKAKGISIYTPAPGPFKQAAQKAQPAWNKAFGAALIKKVRAVAKAQSK